MLEPILVFHTVSILDSIHDQGWYYVTVPVEWTSHQHYISPIPLNKPHPMKVEINICPSTNDKIKIDFLETISIRRIVETKMSDSTPTRLVRSKATMTKRRQLTTRKETIKSCATKVIYEKDKYQFHLSLIAQPA